MPASIKLDQEGLTNNLAAKYSMQASNGRLTSQALVLRLMPASITLQQESLINNLAAKCGMQASNGKQQPASGHEKPSIMRTKYEVARWPPVRKWRVWLMYEGACWLKRQSVRHVLHADSCVRNEEQAAAPATMTIVYTDKVLAMLIGTGAFAHRW
jgi:hypothetical protein